MNIKFYLYILIVLALTSCGSSKSSKKEAAIMESAPSWVKERPINNAYYIGIAKISKITYPDNYRDVSKKKALTDLASEISVNIQSNSIVSSYEDQTGFQSEFSNYIQMEMSKDLSGYQMQGSFESDEMYMVYYRLSKAKWQQILAERKKVAADKAYSLYAQGQKEEKSLNYPAAIKTYLNALLELKKYWNEEVFHSINGEQKRLDLAIRTALIDILTNFRLEVQPIIIEMNMNNHFKSIVKASVINKQGQLLNGFPIRLYYRKQSMPYQATIYSEKQALNIPIESIQYRAKGLFVSLEIDIDQVLPIKSEDKRLLKFISNAYTENIVKVQVNYILPKIFISSVDDENTNYHYVGDAVKQALGKQSFQITSNSKEADLLFNIKIHESIGTTDTKIKTAFIVYSIDVKDYRNANTIYTFSSPKYKGVDYSVDAAKEKAFVKAASEISESSFKDMLQSIIK